jgi:RimJ/RimL family protein N-acetyltransferase
MLKIRPFRWKDAEALRKRNSDPETGKAKITVLPRTLKSTIKYFKEKIKNKDILLVAEEDGEVAGNLEVHRWGGGSKHVGTIGVALKKEFWGQGIGTKLVKEGIKEAKKKRLKKVVYRVVSINKRSINLAMSLKFKLAGRMKKQVKIGRKYCDVLIFEKLL